MYYVVIEILIVVLVVGCSGSNDKCGSGGNCCNGEIAIMDMRDMCCRFEPMESNTSVALLSVWGLNEEEIYAVGMGGAIGHWNGVEWITIPTYTPERLEAIGGVEGWICAAGDGSKVFCSHDGVNFTLIQGVPFCATFYDVWSPGETYDDGMFYSCNYGKIIRASPEGWDDYQHAGDYVLRGIAVRDGPDITAVGTGGLVLSGDGVSWNEERPLGQSFQQNTFTDVFAFENKRYIVGEMGTLLVEDGSGWTKVDCDTSSDFNAIWVGKATLGNELCVFIVGDDGTIVLVNGDGYNILESGTSENLFGIWGESCHDVFAVGSAGTILRLVCYSAE